MAIKKLLPALFDIGDATDGEVFRVSSGKLTKTGSGMVFKDNGRMGIGTASPDRILDINGGTSSYLMQLHNTTAGGEFLEMIGDAGDPVWQFQSGGTGGEGLIKGYDDDVQKVQIAADTDHPTYFLASNVGVGTTAPAKKLTVYDTTPVKMALQNNSSGTGASDGFEFYLSGNNAGIHNYENGVINFATNNTNKMVITADGKVGIGTTAPAKPLHLKVTPGWAALRLEGAADSGGEIEFYKSSTKCN